MKRSIKRRYFYKLCYSARTASIPHLKIEARIDDLATGKLYRETGTTSKEVEQESFVRKIKSENIV